MAQPPWRVPPCVREWAEQWLQPKEKRPWEEIAKGSNRVYRLQRGVVAKEMRTPVVLWHCALDLDPARELQLQAIAASVGVAARPLCLLRRDHNCLLVMEELPNGMSLRAWLKTSRAEDSAARSSLRRSLSAAVDRLHDQHIVHGDLHTENIWVCDWEQRVMLLDFGGSINNETVHGREGVIEAEGVERYDDFRQDVEEDEWSGADVLQHMIRRDSLSALDSDTELPEVFTRALAREAVGADQVVTVEVSSPTLAAANMPPGVRLWRVIDGDRGVWRGLSATALQPRPPSASRPLLCVSVVVGVLLVALVACVVMEVRRRRAG